MVDHLFFTLQKYPVVALSHFMLLLPVAIAVHRREYSSPILWVIGFYFLLHFIEESILLYYVVYKKQTAGIQKSFFLLDVLIAGQAFYLGQPHNRGLRQVGLFSCGVIGGLILADFWGQGLPTFVSAALVRLLLIFFALTYFNRILAENRVLKVIHHPMFWISAGFLIYGMGTFMTSLFTDYLLDESRTSDQTFDLFWNIGQLMCIVQCILAAVGFWMTKLDTTNYIPSA